MTDCSQRETRHHSHWGAQVRYHSHWGGGGHRYVTTYFGGGGHRYITTHIGGGGGGAQVYMHTQSHGEGGGGANVSTKSVKKDRTEC